MAKILDGNKREAISEAASLTKRGGVVAFPTETVYGLGADAFNPPAVAKVFKLKNRPRFDPLIVHISDPSQVESLCLPPGKEARALMEHFWPGPLTLVLPKRPEVPDIVTSGLKSVAVRLPSHPVARALIQEAQCPIAAPSANPFGYLSPTTAQHVEAQLGDRIDIILDGGPCQVGVESTIVAFGEGEVLVLRPGGIPVEEIERVVGKVKIATAAPKQPQSPGQLPRHYSPRTTLKILTNGETGYYSAEEGTGLKAGLLAFRGPVEGNFAMVRVLSPSGDLEEAAANLFTALHQLDSAGLDIILAEAVPEQGIGRAIMDRLRRASK